MIKNTVPDKSGNPEQFESFSTNKPIVGEVLRTFYRLFYSQFGDSNGQ